MSRYYRTLIQGGLLLDTYQNAAVAYSLRKLRSAYYGNCIRIRRSNDNVEQDFGFVNNFVDTESILSFVGDNKWTTSQDFTSVAYNRTGVSVTTGATAAPDSTITGNRLTGTTASTSHRFSRNSTTMVVGLNYNISIYVKADQYFRFRISSVINGTTRFANFNMNTGDITDNTFLTAPNFVDVGNGWWRVDVTQIAGLVSTTSGIIFNILDNSTGSSTFIANGTDSLFVWGAQITQSSSVKDYRATALTAGGAGFITTWYDQSGNSVNASQSSVTVQSQIVYIATPGRIPIVYTDPNTGKVSTFWTSDYYNLSSLIPTVQRMIHVFVFNRINTSGYSIGLGATNAPVSFYWQPNVSGNNIQSNWGGAVTHFTADTGTGAFLATTLRDGTNTVKMWKNGIAGTTGSTSTTIQNFGIFGKFTSPQHSGYVNEMILWKQDYESLRTGIEQNINNYYGIY